MRAFFAAIGNRDVFDTGGLQVFGSQLYGFTGTDQQGIVATEVGKYLTSKTDRCKCHGYRALTNRRVGANLLGDRKSTLEQGRQFRPDRARFRGIAISLLHLSENLWFADDHGIETTAHSHQMSNNVLIGMTKKIGIELQTGLLQIEMHPVNDRRCVRIHHAAVNLGAIARRHNCRFIDCVHLF